MEREVLFEAKDISKYFGENPALKSVHLQVCAGEIVGLVGENGAGKSTLLKIIMGVQPPSDGQMILSGKDYAPRTPKEANARGVGMVFQEQSLITNLTVAQNIFFGDEKLFSRMGYVNQRKMNEAAESCLTDAGLKQIKPDRYVRDLNFATRQMVEIARVMNKAHTSHAEHALILLDEPTSVLNEEEIRLLFEQVRRLAHEGHAIIFVSHHLDEVLELTDRIYVFRDAENAGEFTTAGCTEQMLYEAMVGKSTTSEYYSLERQREPDPEIVLRADHLHLFGQFKDVSFELHRGEILGFCGVVGSGKEELCYVLSGDEKPTSGTLMLKGDAVLFGSPADALKRSLTMIPEERNAEGIFPILSIVDNIAASSLQKMSKGIFLSGRRMTNRAKYWIERLRIRTPGHKAALNSLSGGNAQKVVFGKMLESACGIVLLNHPTRGVDIGAKVEIYGLIRDLAEEGKSIILLGDTLDECIGLSNRILVMKDGLITGEFDAAPDRKPGHLEILQCMM